MITLIPFISYPSGRGHRTAMIICLISLIGLSISEVLFGSADIFISHLLHCQHQFYYILLKLILNNVSRRQRKILLWYKLSDSKVRVIYYFLLSFSHIYYFITLLQRVKCLLHIRHVVTIIRHVTSKRYILRYILQIYFQSTLACKIDTYHIGQLSRKLVTSYRKMYNRFGLVMA